MSACRTNITFTVAAIGNGPPTYQWLFNGQPIPGATNDSYGIPSVPTNAGIYSVDISDSCSTVTSRPAYLSLGFIYGNNASLGLDVVERFDRNAGALIQSYTVSSGNGRGVALVGNILYTTVVGDPNIYRTDATTGASLGSIL